VSVEQLGRELSRARIRGRLASRILAEFQDHLSIDPDADLGEPGAIARQFADELGFSSVMRVLLISGSLRERSTNSAAIRTARQVAPAGMAMTMYMGMGSLPHFNPDDDREDGLVHPAVADLRGHIAGADAILICTPEYAGALPGSLKNLLGRWETAEPIASPLHGSTCPARPPQPEAPLRTSPCARSSAMCTLDIVEQARTRVPLTRDTVADV
jgi:chromate reductase, NAD(P)H dehydrogenase (quinone)